MILDLFHKHYEFYNTQGYDDIKDIVKRALDAEDNYNLLFIGPPARKRLDGKISEIIKTFAKYGYATG